MRKTAIRICIAVIVVCLVLAIAMICMAFMSEKKEYQPASSGKQSTQTETTVMATLRPTPAVTAEPTAEPPVDNVNGVEVPSWPKSPDTRIGICFTDSAANSLAQPALFAGLNEGMGVDYENSNNWVMTNASSVEAVSGFVYDDTFDAILIFPTEGVEYQELVWDAYKSGKAVQFITSEEPKEVFEQVCSIYGKTGVPYPFEGATLNSDASKDSAAWPTHDDPWFYCFFPSGQNIMFDELRSAIMDVANGTKNRELCGESIAAAE